jgi:hypothetical protein
MRNEELYAHNNIRQLASLLLRKWGMKEALLRAETSFLPCSARVELCQEILWLESSTS